MGGAGYIFTGEHDMPAVSRTTPPRINLNILDAHARRSQEIFLFIIGLHLLPAHNQTDLLNPLCAENSAYPAAPDSEYGWEKLFSERLYLAYMRNCKVEVRVARFHQHLWSRRDVWTGGKEKAPAAICRKVAEGA